MIKYESTEFAVHRVVTGSLEENCYLLIDHSSGDVAIIDPGDEAEAISTNLRSIGGRPRHILITHGHYDHIGAVAEIGNLTDLHCSVHQDDLSLLRRAPLYGLAIEKKTVITPEIVETFDGAHTFALGKTAIEVLGTPGHTQGSVCFKIGPLIFTGDTLLRKRKGPTVFPGSNPGQITRSVDYLISNLPEKAVILPGHGSMWDQESATDWWKELCAAENQAREILDSGKRISNEKPGAESTK